MISKAETQLIIRRDLTMNNMPNCQKCGNKNNGEFYHICDLCYTLEQNLPTNVTNSAWIYAENGEREEFRGDRKLHDFIILCHITNLIRPDPKKRIISIGETMEIVVQDDAIDKLAKESGLLSGKWMIYASKEDIDKLWKIVASSVMRNELGISTKVSSAMQKKENYLICVYTKDYFDKEDVDKIRNRLKELGFTHKLYYKTDMYTYLNIYSGTFSGIRASRYSE